MSISLEKLRALKREAGAPAPSLCEAPQGDFLRGARGGMGRGVLQAAQLQRNPPGLPLQAGGGAERSYWQASQLSGFSSEQATASSGVNTFSGAACEPWLIVVLAILVAGRERR